MSKHVMIDIETAGTPDPNDYRKIVLSIGAVAFDHTGVIEDSKLHMCLNIAEQMLKGRSADSETIKWWQDQSKEVQEAAWNLGNDGDITYFCTHALESLNAMIDKNTKVWAKGTIFDIGILQSLFGDFNVVVPWQYRNIFCMRTLRELVDPNTFKVENRGKHNALADAICQAQEVINAKRVTGFWRKPNKLPSVNKYERRFYAALDRLNEPDLVAKFKQNFTKLPEDPNFDWKTPPNSVLSYAFYWPDSREGDGFWQDIFIKLSRDLGGNFND